MADKGANTSSRRRKPRNSGGLNSAIVAKESNGNPESEYTARYNESMQERFERELCWCIQQIDLGLSSTKPDSKQTRDGMKVLKILQNPSALLIKKRQVMRNTFGDYRKKMESEEKKYATSAKKMCLQPVSIGDSLNKQNFTYLKKSNSKNCEVAQHTKTESADAIRDNINIVKMQSTFAFNFTIDKTCKKESSGGNLSKDTALLIGVTADQEPGQDSSSASSELDNDKVAIPLTNFVNVNYFKMEPTSRCNFKFDFEVHEN